MQKKLIALAVAAVAAAPLAAQADVTIYGKMDVSYNVIDVDGAGGINNDSITSNSSRLGFKGSEALGNGVSANFQIEGTIIAAEGGGFSDNRNTWVGLSGDWGEVRMGRHDTPHKIVGRSVDFYESEHLGENRVIFNRGAFGGQDLRVNTIAYISPKVNGFMGMAAYVPNDRGGAAGANNDAGALSLMGKYHNGPWMAAVSYENLDERTATGGVKTPLTTDQDSWRAALKYSANGFVVAGLYQDVSDAGGVKGIDGDAWGIGASYKFGNNVIKATYADSEIDGAGAAPDDDSDMWTIGFDHNFSKRTKIYVNYADVDNNTAGTARLNSNGFDSAGGTGNGGALNGAGTDSDGFTIGMRHKF